MGFQALRRRRWWRLAKAPGLLLLLLLRRRPAVPLLEYERHFATLPLYIDYEVYTLRGLTVDVCYETNGLDLDKDLVGRRMGDEEAQYE